MKLLGNGPLLKFDWLAACMLNMQIRYKQILINMSIIMTDAQNKTPIVFVKVQLTCS